MNIPELLSKLVLILGCRWHYFGVRSTVLSTQEPVRGGIWDHSSPPASCGPRPSLVGRAELVALAGRPLTGSSGTSYRQLGDLLQAARRPLTGSLGPLTQSLGTSTDDLRLLPTPGGLLQTVRRTRGCVRGPHTDVGRLTDSSSVPAARPFCPPAAGVAARLLPLFRV